jgi:cytochrome c2
MARVARWALLAAAGGVALTTAAGLYTRPGAAEAQPQVEPKQLRPGVIVTHRGGGKKPVAVIQLEPTIALALRASEAPHPRLAADGGGAHYQGYLLVERAGTYQFSATLRGKMRLSVGGKEVLSATADGATAAIKEGPPVKLAAGVHKLEGEFERLSGAARLQVYWQSSFFPREPLPYHALRHLPAAAPARLAADQLAERGRFLAEEMSCASCHRPADDDRLGSGLQSRQGPDLSRVGGRTQPGWVYHWLTAGHDQYPGRVMPKLFGDDAAGRTEAFAVAHYLATLGGPLPQPKVPGQLPDSVARGQRLFTAVGCAACHRAAKDVQANPGPVASLHNLAAKEGVRNYPLYNLGGKTTPAKLAEYLADPLATDPSGRMPHLLLDAGEARDLANYLCLAHDAGKTPPLPATPTAEQLAAAFKRVDGRADELAEFQKLTPPKQLIDLGKRLVIDRGCNNCHQIAPDGQPFANVYADADFSDIQSPKHHDRGCLAADAMKRGKAPRFALAGGDRAALTAFLREGATGAGAPSGVHAANVALQRFNCLACHTRDGDGGLSPDLLPQLKQWQKAEHADEVLPPSLTGVGGRLRTPWLGRVLTQAGRARPWLALRMPQFGKDHVGHLPASLAALAGVAPDDAPHKTAVTAEKIAAGRRMVGSQGFSCVACHDLAGAPGTAARGPDLATMAERVRYDWYRRWLESPQRIEPGTKMPTVFPDGRSLLRDVLNGDADAQADALWSYLSLGPKLPPPKQ